MRHSKDLAFSLAGAEIAVSGLSIISYSLIGLVVSTAAVGKLGASLAVMAPVTTFTSATVLFLLPEAARWRREGGRKLISSSAWMSIGLGVFVIAAAGVIALLPGTLTSLLAGPNWQIARHLLLPIAIWIAATAARQAPTNALRALAKGRTVLYLSIVNGITLMVGALIGGAFGGAGGAAWGFATGNTVAMALWWVTLLGSHREPNPSSVVLPEQIRAPG
jgi:O-antigen/teichoic acid export membrane protein